MLRVVKTETDYVLTRIHKNYGNAQSKLYVVDTKLHPFSWLTAKNALYCSSDLTGRMDPGAEETGKDSPHFSPLNAAEYANKRPKIVYSVCYSRISQPLSNMFLL